MSYFYRVEEDDTSFQQSVYKCLLCFGVGVCVQSTTCGCVLFGFVAHVNLEAAIMRFLASNCAILFVKFW